MKVTKLILLLFLLPFIIMSCNSKPIELDQSVNAIIGDISYLKSFGNLPADEADEDIRLQTHLKYVEKVLRETEVSGLTKEQKVNRLKMLDLLNDYWTAGVFPKNYDFPDKRIPCFIDRNGNICAVGYLIEQTAGRQIAEDINAKFKYEYLLAMNEQVIDNWIQASGLTKEECAMIQPAYGPSPTDNYISPANGISSSMLGGLNLSLSAINGVQIARGTTNNAIPVLGLVAGAGQLAFGVLKYPQGEESMNGMLLNETQRNLSLFHIGLGTSTMVLSTWNLITNKKPKQRMLAWNVYSFQTPNRNMGLGLSLTKQL